MLSPYEQPHTFQAQLNGQPLTVVTRPGLPEWDHVTATQALLAEHARPQGRTLLLGCDHGALAVSLARQFSVASASSLSCADDNWIAHDCTPQTLRANHLPPANLISPHEIGGPYDTVIIRLPKGRKLTRRWLLEAHAALTPAGTCYLGGANSEGIQSVLKDGGELFGGVAVLGYRKGCRVGRMIREAGDPALPAWAHEPGVFPASWHEFDVAVRDLTFHIRSLPGVFSFDQLDPGSRLLLENLVVSSGARVLDFGCGCGVLGMAAARWGAAHVDMVDANLLAVAAAQENLQVNDITNARVLPSDLLDAVQGQRYDQIITNPPFHAGHAVNTGITQRFLAQAQASLTPTGELIMVANRFLRYELFGQVDMLAANNQYHILRARPHPPENATPQPRKHQRRERRER